MLTTDKSVEGRAAFLANYWPVVALVLKRYQPAAVAGVAAIRVHLEDFSPPEDLASYQGANQSEYKLTLYPGFRLRLRPRPLTADDIMTVTAPGSLSPHRGEGGRNAAELRLVAPARPCRGE